MWSVQGDPPSSLSLRGSQWASNAAAAGAGCQTTRCPLNLGPTVRSPCFKGATWERSVSALVQGAERNEKEKKKATRQAWGGMIVYRRLKSLTCIEISSIL